MLVLIVLVILVLVVLVLSWYTWRLFGSFHVQNQVEHAEQTDALERLTEAQVSLEDATEKLTHELELLRIGVRQRR